MAKFCEKCGVEIPESYNNLLCSEHYTELSNKESQVKAENPVASPVVSSTHVINGISDPNYHENEQMEEIDMVSRMHGRFKGIGLVMPEPQRILYTAIKDWFRNECVTKNVQYPKFIWKPTVADIGSGLGVGSNILSQEADYVLGVDKNEENIRFASQLFTREKNNMYWTSQLDFMVADVTSETREFMKFDFVVCVEVFEHLKDYGKLLEFLRKLMKPTSTLFISTPNRNSDKIAKDKPRNEHHVFEPTSQEFKAMLSPYFSKVQLLDYSLNPVADDTDITPIVAKVSL